jgi:hypothetical protein
MRRAFIAVAIFEMLVLGGVRAGASPKPIYLDKLDKTLDDWWNALDGACRGEPGGSEESNLACDQRLALDKIIINKGCRNIHPANGPHDTSYWVCKPK